MEKIQFQTTLLDKAKAANNNAQIDNLSERTISEIVDMFHPQFIDDEKITDESWKIPVQMIKTMSGQLRHDTSTGINAFKSQFEAEQKTAQQKAIDDAVAAFKSQWEKDHPDPNKNDDKDIAKLVAEQVAAQMKVLTGEESDFGKLSKQMTDYLATQIAREKAASVESLRKQILEYITEFDGLDEDDAIVENVILKLDIKDDKKLDDLKNEAKSLYEKAYKNFVTKHGGGEPFTGGGGNDENTGAKGWLKNKGVLSEAEEEAAEKRKKLLK